MAEGSFAGAIAHGTVAPGRSAPIPLSGAGSQPLVVAGRGKGSYRLTGTVQVKPIN